MVGVVAPTARLAIIVIAAHHGPDGGRLGQARHWSHRARQHQRHLIDAQQLLVRVLVRGALAPDVLASQVGVAQRARHRGDGLLAQQVRPDDQRRIGREPGHRACHPGLREGAVVPHGLEADDGVAIDLLVGPRIALVPPFAPPGEQAVRGIGEQQAGAGLPERGPIALRLAGVGSVAAQGLGWKIDAHPTAHPTPGGVGLKASRKAPSVRRRRSPGRAPGRASGRSRSRPPASVTTSII